MKRTYPVVIETDEKGGFSAFFPDVLGCAAAGDSQEECFADAQEAIVFHLAGMAEDGDPAPAATHIDDLDIDDDIIVSTIAFVTVDVPGKKQRTNLTLDSAVLAAIDTVSSNRSAFLEDAAIAELKRRQAL